MSGNRIELVCFDLGGVLVKLSKDWADACARGGVAVVSEDAAAWAAHQALLRRLEVGEVDEQYYLREVPRCLPGAVVEDVLKAFDAWLLGLYPGARELIDDLKDRGIKTAILSNTNARHWRMVSQNEGEYTPLLRIDHLLASHQIRAAKPGPAAYRAVEAASGVSGGAVLFFDDTPPNIEGARAVGWRAELIDQRDAAVEQVRQYLAKYGLI